MIAFRQYPLEKRVNMKGIDLNVEPITKQEALDVVDKYLPPKDLCEQGSGEAVIKAAGIPPAMIDPASFEFGMDFGLIVAMARQDKEKKPYN